MDEKRDGQLETLDDLSEAIHYNRWIYSLMEPHLGRRVLEVGCGIGNMTRLLAEGRQVLAVDIHPGYLERARRTLRSEKNISFKKVNLEKPLSSVRKFRPDTIVCVNVFEHIEADVLFLKECRKLLPTGGRVLIFVPALTFLYGSMDAHYGHFRRYSMTDLKRKLSNHGFHVSRCRYLNLLGVFGWWWNGIVLKKTIVPRTQILIYDKIVRWVALVEKWLPKPIGLSLFCVGEKSTDEK